MELIHEIPTHKAVINNGQIEIYSKGLDPHKMNKGTRLFTWQEVEYYKDLFKDEVVKTLPLTDRDMVPVIMGLYQSREKFKREELQQSVF